MALSSIDMQPRPTHGSRFLSSNHCTLATEASITTTAATARNSASDPPLQPSEPTSYERRSRRSTKRSRPNFSPSDSYVDRNFVVRPTKAHSFIDITPSTQFNSAILVTNPIHGRRDLVRHWTI